MHPYHVLPYLIRLLTREEGLTMSEVMWSLAVVAMIAGIAYFVGPALGADWREFVGDTTR
jgi:prepilin-type N-terminal cleavage/methylation domain-containing protein